MIKETPKILTSSQNPLVKHWVRLRENRSYREQEGSVVIFGKKLVEEVGKISPPKALLYKRDTPLSTSLQCKSIYYVTEEILKKVTGVASPESIAAEVPLPLFSSLKGKNKIIACDGISDPGNLGTLIRSALALGWGGAFLLPSCVDPFNDKAIRASKGGVFSLPLREGGWEELQDVIRENELEPFVADIDATPFSTLTFPKKILLVLGSEAHGPSLEGKQVGKRISIPINSQMESLNVAVAGGILMYSI